VSWSNAIVLITAILCATIVALAWLRQEARDEARDAFEYDVERAVAEMRAGAKVVIASGDVLDEATRRLKEREGLPQASDAP
jgi:uncharacterized membrane protein